jgi:hypothetical protein
MRTRGGSLHAHVIRPHTAHALPLQHNAGVVHLPLGGEGAEEVVRGHEAWGRRKGSEASFLGETIKNLFFFFFFEKLKSLISTMMTN